MKYFERLVMTPLQFSYQANRTVDDVANVGLYYILHHLDSQGCSAQSSTPSSLKSSTRGSSSFQSLPAKVSGSPASWLTGRSRGVGEHHIQYISNGAHQGCVLSPPFLFSVHQWLHLSRPFCQKDAESTTVTGLIWDSDESLVGVIDHCMPKSSKRQGSFFLEEAVPLTTVHMLTHMHICKLSYLMLLHYLKHCTHIWLVLFDYSTSTSIDK